MHPRHFIISGLITWFFALSAFATGAANDWPQWRGPNRDGVAPPRSLPETLPQEPQRDWAVEVGVGHASPVVVGETIYQFARLGNDEVLMALSLDDGRELWRWSEPTPYSMNPAAIPHGKGPKSTPVVVDDTICSLGIAGRLACLDRTSGAVRWSRDGRGSFDASEPDFGAAMSPAVFDGRLIVHVGGNRTGALVALDPRTGEESWRWDGPPAYASPILVELDGVQQIVTQSRSHIIAVDSQRGHELWRLPFTTAYDQNSVTPLQYGDMLILSGIGTSVFAVRPRRNDAGTWLAERVWENSEVPMYMSSPVLSGEVLFGLTDRRKGQLFAMNPANGELLWQSEGREGDNASLVLADSRLLVLTTGGEVQVGTAGAERWRPDVNWEVATSPTWAHPAIAGGKLLIKDKTHLIAYSLD